MDIKDRVMGDKPNSWLHKIAGIVPGFKGYTDRERRRDADKLLRVHLAKQYSAQRDRLNRVQQSLLRAKRMDQIAEVDRLGGVLQRFIDRLNTATYGYTGMFDPVKIEAEDLDQLYAFDMTLAAGVDQVSAAVSAIEESVSNKESDALPGALSSFSDLVDDLNEKLNQRGELLTSGTRVAPAQFQSMLSNLDPLPPYQQAQSSAPNTGTGEVYPGRDSDTSSSTGMNTDTGAGGDMARYGGGGVPTNNLGVAPYGQPEPGMSSMTEGNTSFSPMPAGSDMGNMDDAGPMPMGGEAGTGTESASSPAAAPGAPGHDIVDGMNIANNLERVANTDAMDNQPPRGNR
jgi:hypothetical protein